MVSLIITVFVGLLESALIAFYEIRILAVLSIFSGIFHILLLYLFLKTYNLNIVGCYLAIIGKDLLVLVVYGRKLLKIFSKYKASKPVKIKNKRLLNFVTPGLFNNFVNRLVLSQSETLYLGYFSTQADVGIYNVAYTFPQRLITVVPLILRGITTAAITDFYLKDKAYLKRLTELYYKLLFLFIAPFSIGGALLLDKGVVMIYGADMGTAGRIAQVLFIVHTFILFSNPYTFVMRTLENMWIGFRISVISAIVSISLNLILISQYGLIGAVVSTSITLFINGLLRFIIYRRHYPFVEVPWKNICKCYASTLCFLIILPFKHLISNPLDLILAFLFLIAVWIIAVKVIKLIDENELRFLESLPIPYSKQLAEFFKQ
jgi:O-antigen/teichoic acid export membrane protein